MKRAQNAAQRVSRKPYLGGRRRLQCATCRGPNETRGVNCPKCARAFNRKQNAEYDERRVAKRCVDCNAPSALAHCKACRARRKSWPSRNGKSKKVIAQRKRWRLNAKRRRAQEARSR